MAAIRSKHIAAACVVLGFPALIAVLVWSIGLILGGAIFGAALLVLVFSPGLVVFYRLCSKVFRQPMKSADSASTWTPCAVVNGMWCVLFIVVGAPLLALYPFVFGVLSLVGHRLEQAELSADA